MTTAFRAGVVYFAVIFAVGFVLGTLRVLVLLRYIDETAAVVVELPIILTVSWFVCRVLIKKFNVGSTLAARLFMGAVALVLLIAAEQVLGILLFDRNSDEINRHYQATAGVIGLAGQGLFALFPILQLIAWGR